MNHCLKNMFNAVLLVGAMGAGYAYADSSTQMKGLKIASERVERNSGWHDEVANMEMLLHDGSNNISSRKLKTQYLEVEGDGDKNLSIFISPRDIKNTIFLSHTHTTAPDDQWIFLPALKRLKRISSANKSGPFVGSEFSFEDLASFELDRYKFDYIKDDVVDGRDCYIIESVPTYDKTGYSRLESCLDKETYMPLKVEFFDDRNEHSKTLMYTGYNKYNDSYWRVSVMTMTNHLTGKYTELHWSDYQFNTGLTSNDFDKRVLVR